MEAKPKRPTFREWVVNFRSPIRWGFAGAFLAMFLFCIEIALSLAQIYLSVYWDEGRKMPSIVLPLLIILLILAILGIVGVMAVAFYFVVLWHKHPPRDDVLQATSTIQKSIDSLSVTDGKKPIKNHKSGRKR